MITERCGQTKKVEQLGYILSLVYQIFDFLVLAKDYGFIDCVHGELARLVLAEIGMTDNQSVFFDRKVAYHEIFFDVCALIR